MSGTKLYYHHRCHCLLETGRKFEVSFLRRQWPGLVGGLGLGMLPSDRYASVGVYEDIHHCGYPRLYYRFVRRKSTEIMVDNTYAEKSAAAVAAMFASAESRACHTAPL